MIFQSSIAFDLTSDLCGREVGEQGKVSSLDKDGGQPEHQEEEQGEEDCCQIHGGWSCEGVLGYRELGTPLLSTFSSSEGSNIDMENNP